ncbi:Metallo-dependent phosphatase [Coprinopsis marcescibilis]|uniref:Metallo-dependent phosphatase n=1 Tax=Coprinopsis marcescibilis TaxID=230819 RepID=A0A5C3KPT1_COPMA|nr:Metallo-dependent phosphatase [Coprinopsis marcescibilis]
MSTNNTSTPITLGIAHFNDKVGTSGGTIDVTKFGSLLEGITAKWKQRDDGARDGLIVFSGDFFSPSIESSITRGRHMPPIVNALNVDIAIVGYPRTKELIALTTFPWLLSNVIDETTGTVPEPLKEFHILERVGLRIGLIGLVEMCNPFIWDWIPTITGWPKEFIYQDIAEIGKKLSAKLRDPQGEYKCDLVIALTHSRIQNDIALARDLFALSPAAQANTNIAAEHGVDIILGGHDHIYWITKGVTAWEGYDVNTPTPEDADDRGDILVVKSGYDFRDLSEVVLTLQDTPQGSIKKKVNTAITGKRHSTAETTPVHIGVQEVYEVEIGTIDDALVEPICTTEVELNVQSTFVRVHEAAISNWVGDCLHHAYDEALAKLGYAKADGVFLNAGGLRGDRVYPPGNLTLGDLLTVLPFLDPVVVIEIYGNTLWDALESGLSKRPAQEGRFPEIAGFRVEWDIPSPFLPDEPFLS